MGRRELRPMRVMLKSRDWMKCPLEMAENGVTQCVPLTGSLLLDSVIVAVEEQIRHKKCKCIYVTLVNIKYIYIRIS